MIRGAYISYSVLDTYHVTFLRYAREIPNLQFKRGGSIEKSVFALSGPY